ncbi:hypothetical protein NIES4071_64790 [Calothrix sp. NIES-4071]|nr:hypothetical protein NIES4071_64790 [Calothrix sp. NIES-4071]BAZ60783.1 hypothetical protein NIES4105_64750 [Calothrix sp. NIES-4105]
MTSVFNYIPQSDPPLPPHLTLPTMYDLPSENPLEPGLPDDFHYFQPLLLRLTFQPTNWNRDLVYSAADLNLYYDKNHPLWYKVYEHILRVPYYIVFIYYINEVKPYILVGGHYEAINFNSDGRLDMPELGLSLGLWEGAFRGIDRLWLRWFTLEGELILFGEEKAQLAKQEAVEAKQEAIKAQKRVEELAEKLRQLGINPDEIV